MKLNHFILIPVLLLFTISTPTAAKEYYEQNTSPQGRKFSPQEFIKKQEAFIIREVGLSPAEAASFFPLYHNMNNQLRKIDRNRRQLMKKAKNEKLTNKEYQNILDTLDQLESQKVKTTTEYHKKFLKVIDAQKIISIMDASNRFERQMLRRIMERPRRARPN